MRRVVNSLFSLFRVLVVLIASTIATVASAELVSVPFKEGFVGTIGSSNRQALNIRTFAALGIEASLVQQNSSTSQFESPTGNDIPVDLVLIQGGTTFTIPGSVSWKVKNGGVLQIFGFTPDSSQPTYQDITLTIPGGGTYSLVGSSNYGVVKTSTTLANLGIVDGQSSVSGSNDPVNLADLNDYLDDVRASRPFGPITTDSQTVYATLNGGSYTSQPTITGEACIVTASTTSAGTERIDVVVDGTGYANVSYTVQGDGQVGSTTCDTDATDGLTIEAVTWSLDLSAQSPAQSVTPGTYDITASVITTAPIYNMLTDSTSGELEVVYENAELTVTKTAALDKTVAGGAASVDVGDVINYQISIENTGNIAMATPSSLTDTITASGASNLTLTYASGDTGSDNVISVGETWVYTASYTLDSGDLLTGQVDNIAEVSATSSLGTAITVQSSATGNTTSTGSVTTTTFSSLSSLFISKTASLDTEVVGGANDTSVDVGDQITYTVTVSNTGNTVLNNVVVSDTLSRVAADNTATTVASTATTPALLGTANDNDGTTSGSTMNPNEQWVYTYVYTLTQDDIDAGRMSNLASVTDGSLYVESTTAGNTDTSVLAGAAPSGSPTVTSLTQSPEMLVKKVTDLTVSGAPYLTGNNADIVDQDASGTVSVGDRVYFTITVKNTGNVTLSSVSLADTLTTNESTPSTLSMTSGPTLTADTGATGDAILAVGDIWTYSGYYALTQNDIDLGVGIKNLATFTATPPSGTGISTGSTAGGNTSGAGSAIVVSLEGTAAITGVKTVAITTDTGATGLSLGDTLTYTIVATNSGDVTLTDVGISAETLSRGTTSLTAISGFGVGDFATTDSTTLAPGASATFTATYVVTQDDIDAGGLSNTATVEGTAPGGSTVDDVTDDGDTGAGDTGADPTVSTVSSTAAITGIKTVAITNDTGATGLSLGDTLTYTIVATNSGDVTLTGVGISAETLSRGTTSLTAISGFGASDFATTDSTTLAPGASATFIATYVVTQDDIDAGGLSNTATVEGTALGGSTVNDVTDDGDTGAGDTGADPTVSTITSAPAIAIQKTVDDSALNDGVRAGDVLHYTITIENIGDVTLQNIAITDNLSDMDGTALSLDAAPAKSSDTGANTADAILEIGDVWTYTADYTLTASDIAAGGVENIAIVTAETPSGATVTAESKTSGNTSNDGDGAPTETGFPGEISGTVIEYQAGVQGVIVYLLEETSPGVYDYVDDPQNPGTRLSTTTDANGNYSFVGLPPLTYGIEFSNPNSDAVPTASSAMHAESGNRILGITVGAGAVEVEQDAFLIDPSGVVYDSATFAPLSGATVTLYYQSSTGASARIVPDSWLDTEHGDANGVVTGSDGKYAYFLKSDRARDGIYTLDVEKADYLFTSSTIAPHSGSYNAGLGGHVVPITADATPRAAMDTTYYLAFEMVFTGSAATSSNGVVHNNIPLDAIPSLLPEIEDDLVQILKDDLSATMTQQGQEMAGFAAGALDRLKQRDSNSCAADVAKELADNPIRFATASAVILPESEETLNRIAALLATCPEAAFEVAGHTDDQADADYNQRLSQSRAANIVAALSARGIAAERLSAAGYGESRPVADNATEEGRLLNRRVEFVAVDMPATEEPCRNTQTLVRDLNIQGDENGLTAEGSFNSEVRDCAIDGWRIFSGSTSYLTDDGISQGMFKLNYRVERFATNDRVSGWFAGIYGSDDTISGSATGSIKGFGVNGGLYGAARLDANLFADYYLGAAAGRHSFDLDFERAQGTINAEGSYDYYALFAGAALSGEFDVNDYVLAPRFGVDAAWSPGGEAWVTASRSGFEESGALSTGEVSGLRFFGELGVADLLVDDPAVLSITPRFFCERAIGADDNTCGMGAKLSYESRNEVTGDHVGFELDVKGAKGRQYYSVGVNVGQPMFGGDVETNVGVGANGSVDLGLTYTAAF